MQNARKRYNPKTLCDITESHFCFFFTTFASETKYIIYNNTENNETTINA